MAAPGKRPPDVVEELVSRLGALRAHVDDEVDALEELALWLDRARPPRGLSWRLPSAQPRCPAAGQSPELPWCANKRCSATGPAAVEIKAAAADIEAASAGCDRADLLLVNPEPKAREKEKLRAGASTTKNASAMHSSMSSINIRSQLTGVDGERKSNKVNILDSQHQMSFHFEGLFAMAILVGSALSGAEVQWKAYNLGEEVPYAFTVTRNILTLVFLLEFALRVCIVGPRRFFCSPGERTWALLDCVAVFGGLLEMAADGLWLFASSSSTASSQVLDNSFVFRNVRLLRILRITRAFRLQRIIRFISALKILVYSIAVTLKSLVWAMILLIIIVYVFGLAFTMEAIEIMEDMKARGEDPPDIVSCSWGTLERSMFTLYKSISGGVSWGEPLEPLQASSVIPTSLFTLYIAFTYFAVLNVVTGVFCSSALETTQKNPDLVARALLDRQKKSAEMLRNLFGAIDEDDSGIITTDELELITNDEMVRAYFQALDIDFRDAFTLFKLIDSNQTGSVKLEDFVMGCEQLRGGATSVHIAEVAHEVKKLHREFRSFMEGAC